MFAAAPEYREYFGEGGWAVLVSWWPPGGLMVAFSWSPGGRGGRGRPGRFWWSTRGLLEEVVAVFSHRLGIFAGIILLRARKHTAPFTA